MATNLGTPVSRRDGTVQVSFEQDAAGAGTLVADPGDGVRVILVSFFVSLDASGSVKFTGGDTGDLCGDLSLGAGVPIGYRGNTRSPALEAAKSEALGITSVTGKASGWIVYRIAAS
jgi:hypothetical protein